MPIEDLPQSGTITRELDAVKRRRVILYGRGITKDYAFELGRDIDRLEHHYFGNCQDPARLQHLVHLWCLRHLDRGRIQALIDEGKLNPEALVQRLEKVIQQFLDEEEGGASSLSQI